MNQMNQIIKEKLAEIEQRENVKVIHACESGSRAWGFASPDSDYDVRFIYVRPVEYYLKLEKTVDVINWQLDETLDINGWDLIKALRLLHSSNPTLFEWNNSPIVYLSTPVWEEISSHIEEYFLSESGIYHYISTAKSNYREYLKGNEVKIKKYFYVLRPILAAEWIFKYNSAPPMLFDRLKEEFLTGEILDAVNDLVEKKKITPELGLGKRIDVINRFLDNEIIKCEEKAKTIKSIKKDWSGLDALFIRALHMAWKE